MSTAAAAAAGCRGKWSSASKEEVEAEMAKGTPYCYRFRVPANKVREGGASSSQQQSAEPRLAQLLQAQLAC
jgi:hypothetical protein